MDDDSTLEVLLRPWWDVFPANALSVQHNVWKHHMRKELHALRLVVPSPCVSKEAAWRRQCMAIELLMLASRLRPQTFMRLARMHCRPADCLWGEVDEDQVVPCRLVIGLDDKHGWQKYPGTHLDALSLLLSPETSVVYPPDVAQTREALLEMARTQSEREQCEKMKIPVSVELHFQTEGFVNNALEYLLQLHQVHNQERHDKVVRRREHPFYMESIGLNHGGMVSPRDVVTLRTLDHLQNFPTQGLHSSYILFTTEAFNNPVQHRSFVGDLVRTITATPTGINEDSNSQRGTQVVEVTKMERKDFASFCSGLMHSRGIEHLTLCDMLSESDTDGDSIMKWYWLIYALFHASASHSIGSLKICTSDIPTEHIRCLEDFTGASQPIQVMYGNDSASTAKTGSFVVLAGGTPIYLQPTSSWNTEHLDASSSALPYRVIGSLDDEISVVVPGYGQCWVKTADITSFTIDPFEVYPEKQWNLKAHGITQLMLCVSESEDEDEGKVPTWILSLLKLIGEPLTSLTIQFPDGSQLGEFELNQIWTYCPNLTYLSIDGAKIPSLDVFVDMYESGKCQVTSITLHMCLLAIKQGVELFTVALGDPSTKIAQTLQHVRLLLMSHELDDEDEEDEGSDEIFAKGLLAALKKNNRLALVDLELDGKADLKYREGYKELSGQCISCVRKPLPLQAMLAFLSVVMHAQTQCEPNALARMSTDVVSQIFFLGGTPELRTIIMGGEKL